VRAICSQVAKYLDNFIEERKIRPDVHGNYVFSLLRRDFIKFVGGTDLSNYFKRVLKDFGYRIKVHTNEIIIVKFLN
jgi:hypothetical protein